MMILCRVRKKERKKGSIDRSMHRSIHAGRYQETLRRRRRRRCLMLLLLLLFYTRSAGRTTSQRVEMDGKKLRSMLKLRLCLVTSNTCPTFLRLQNSQNISQALFHAWINIGGGHFCVGHFYIEETTFFDINYRTSNGRLAGFLDSTSPPDQVRLYIAGFFLDPPSSVFLDRKTLDLLVHKSAVRRFIMK